VEPGDVEPGDVEPDVQVLVGHVEVEVDGGQDAVHVEPGDVEPGDVEPGDVQVVVGHGVVTVTPAHVEVPGQPAVEDVEVPGDVPVEQLPVAVPSAATALPHTLTGTLIGTRIWLPLSTPPLPSVESALAMPVPMAKSPAVSRATRPAFFIQLRISSPVFPLVLTP
jgi:hypothetical protein